MDIEELTLRQVREIYDERILRDFTPDEIKPLFMIERAMAAGHYACYGAFDGTQISAYAFFVINGGWALLDYFAVREEMRGTGYGSRFLQGMAEGMLRRFKMILLESEDPAYAETDEERAVMERRLHFYRKNGLTETGILSTLWHVHYRVLLFPTGDILSADEIRKVYRSLYRILIPEKLYQTMIWVN